MVGDNDSGPPYPSDPERVVGNDPSFLDPTRIAGGGLAARMLLRVWWVAVIVVVVAIVVVLVVQDDGGDEATSETATQTASTEPEPEPATGAAPSTEEEIAASDGCMPADQVNEEVIGGLLPEGRLLTTEDRVTDNYDWGDGIQAEEAYPVCSYRYEDYRYTATYVSPGGERSTSPSTADIKLEYGRFTPTFSSSEELLSEAFETLSASMYDEYDGSQLHDVQSLDYMDTSSFVYVEESAYAYYYIDDDSLCVGYANAGDSDLSGWANVAAHQLAARVACDLDVDVPESPGELAPVGESPATTEDSGCELETDDAGETWEVCPDGSRTFVGGGL